MTDSNPTCRSSTPSLFLSAVSDEFGGLRRRLDKYLSRQDVQVHEQMDFNQGGGTLLQHLDEYIRHCHAVLHVVGAQTGKPIKRAEAQWLLATHPDFLDRFPSLSDDLNGDEPTLSYTQAEAWLAWYYRGHGTRPDLFCYRPQALLDARPPEADPQERHWQRLRIEGKDRRGFADIGDLVGQMTHDLPRFEPTQRPCKLPFEPLGDLFIGRDEFIHDLRQRVDRARENDRWPIQVVHGLGGVGKTRATVEYAWRYRRQYAAVLSVTADSPGALERELAGLCGVLRINVTDSTTDPERIAKVSDWLRQHPGWLLLVDNVDTDEARDAVAGRLPQWAADGHVLITGRVTQWPRGVDPLDLWVLAPTDAAKFLLDATAGRRRRQADDGDQALRLASDDLGCLCLALEQAAAYVAEVEISFADYRGRWATNADNVRGWSDQLLMRYREAGGVSLSVATTWQTTFEQLTPTARALLEMLSMLAPDPLPLGLLQHEAMTAALATLVPLPRVTIEQALAELRRYSMVSRVLDTGSESAGQVHRLVQQITRDKLPRQRPGQLGRWLRRALGRPPVNAANRVSAVTCSALDKYCPKDLTDVRSWPTAIPLLPHLIALGSNATPAISPAACFGCEAAGSLLYSKASYATAEPLLRRALAISETIWGRKDSQVATLANNLAALLAETNRWAEAEHLKRQALALHVATKGPTSPEVATDLSNLAMLLMARERLSGAEPLMRRAVAIDKTSLRQDDPRVGIRLGNMANLLRAMKHLGEAESLMREALTAVTNAYGPQHPTVATQMANLAQILQERGKSAEAEPLMRRALKIDEAEYGPKHPKVASQQNNLAMLLVSTNRCIEAEPLMRAATRSLLSTSRAVGHDLPAIRTALVNYRGLLHRLALAETDVDERLRSLYAEAGLRWSDDAKPRQDAATDGA